LRVQGRVDRGESAERDQSIFRGAVLVVLASAAFAVLGIALLVSGARWIVPGTLAGPLGDGGWVARSRAWFTVRGLYDPEIDRATLHQFSWTGQSVRFVIPHLDRSQSYRVTVRVAAGRPADAPLPEIRLSVDGVALTTTRASSEPQRVSVDVPRRRGANESAAIVLDVSSTVMPGPTDPRPLGVVIDDIELTPAEGHFRPTMYVATRTGVAIFACVLGVLLCGLRSSMAALAGTATTVAFVWLLLQDCAFLGGYVDRLLNMSFGVAAAGAIVALARGLWPATGTLPEWPIAAGLVLCASAVKLAFFVHPLITIGDAVFQVHRAQLVHAGTYFFTSVTPKPFFEFPYAIALYVAALPLWQFFPTVPDLVRLLRGVALGADALVGLALYAAARRQWHDGRAALWCAGLWLFARAPVQAFCNANLTNLFGQALFSVAMGVIAWTGAATPASNSKPGTIDGGSVAAMVAACGLLTAAFLSHFSTLSVGVPIVCTTGVLCVIVGEQPVRKLGVLIVVSALAVSALAYGVYYSNPRFTPVYRQTLARVMSHEDAQESSKMVAPAATKVRRLLAETGDDYGLPGIVLGVFALAGTALLVAERGREAFTLVLLGWGLAWLGLTTLGIVTPIEMRTNLAAAPVFVCLGAYALGHVAARSRAGTAVAAIATVAIGWAGLRLWLMCLGRW
jgi:hypothetical protein